MSTFNQLIKNKRIPKISFNRSSKLQKSPQKKGTCLKVYTTSPKKPNSANRKVTKILLSNKKTLIAYVPGITYTAEQPKLAKHSTVLVRGGRVKDLPGVNFKIIRGVYDFASLQSRNRARSKYGTKKLFR
jgi:small subunit ribosomal protein S12